MRLHLPREHPEIGPSGREVNHVFRILVKKPLGENVSLFEIEAPRVAGRHRAGQFVMVRPHARSERIPLTIADVDRAAGTITLVVQAVGKTTIEMTEEFDEGDAFANVAGPARQPDAHRRARQARRLPGNRGLRRRRHRRRADAPHRAGLPRGRPRRS